MSDYRLVNNSPHYPVLYTMQCIILTSHVFGLLRLTRRKTLLWVSIIYQMLKKKSVLKSFWQEGGELWALWCRKGAVVRHRKWVGPISRGSCTSSQSHFQFSSSPTDHFCSALWASFYSVPATQITIFLETYPFQGKFINFGVERSLLGGKFWPSF